MHLYWRVRVAACLCICVAVCVCLFLYLYGMRPTDKQTVLSTVQWQTCDVI